jgi:putative glycosyltransferase (TIGR04372 family)
LFIYLFDKLNTMRGFPYLIVSPLPYAIGTACEEIYLAAVHALEEKKEMILLRPMKFTEMLGYRRCNLPMFRVKLKKPSRFLRTFRFFLEILTSIDFFFRRTISLFLKKAFGLVTAESWRFPRLGIKTIYYTGIPKAKIKATKDCCLEKLPYRPFDIFIPHLAERKSVNRLKELGLEAGQKHVCLHIREAGYRKDGGRREYRNAGIKNYVEGVSKLINAGYRVFRLGDDSMTPFPVKMKGLMDCPFTDLKSDAMDLYLLKNCDFFIGMQSGLVDTAWLFQKPVLVTNMYSAYSAFPRSMDDRGIFKHVKVKGAGQFLTLREWLQQPWYAHNYSRDILEYEFVENSSEEIYEAIHEFIQIQTKKMENHPTPLQKEFNRLLKETLWQYIHEAKEADMNSFGFLSELQKVRISRMTLSCEGTLSAGFLEKKF